MKAQIGHITKVKNLNRKTNANHHYFSVWAMDSGKPTPLLMTDAELVSLKERADKNKVDLPLLNVPIPKKKSFFARLFGKFSSEPTS